MRNCIYLISIVLVFVHCNRIDSDPEILVTRFMNESPVPGLFVAVVRGDTVLYQNGFGFSDNENKVKVSANTCMELGSISKAFTGQLIYQLHSEKKLDIGDPITKYLPGAPQEWSAITIGHLLKHTSGIQNYLLDPRFKAPVLFGAENDAAALALFQNISTDSMLRMFYSLPLEFAPGTSWSYSNTGYYLLGLIAESVTGKRFFDLAHEEIIKPLGLVNTRANEIAAREGCLAKGYLHTDTGFRIAPVLYSNTANSAGAWATNGTDMIKYLKAIHNKSLPVDSTSYNWRQVPADTLPFTYAGGCFYATYHGMTVLSHNGGTPGFSSSWIHVPGKNISVIVLMNRQDYAPIEQLAWDILSSFEESLKYPSQKLEGAQELKYSSEVFEVLQAIKNNKPMPTGLTPALNVFLGSENGRGLWKWFFDRGLPDSIFCVDSEITGSGKIFRFRLPYSKRVEYRLTVQTNDKGELMQLRWW